MSRIDKMHQIYGTRVLTNNEKTEFEKHITNGIREYIDNHDRTFIMYAKLIKKTIAEINGDWNRLEEVFMKNVNDEEFINRVMVEEEREKRRASGTMCSRLHNSRWR